jgi:hypothetical protein
LIKRERINYSLATTSLRSKLIIRIKKRSNIDVEIGKNEYLNIRRREIYRFENNNKEWIER